MIDFAEGELYYDPYDFEIDTDPYPVWKRLRDEAPLYYNEKHDFYASSRFDDVKRCSTDWSTYISGKGSVLELIKSGMEIPPGVILFEDPPAHDLHRSLLSRVFTPRRMAEIEPQARAFWPGRSIRSSTGEIRLHPRPGGGHADAGHRHVAGHSRGGPGGDSRPDRRRHAARGGRGAGASEGLGVMDGGRFAEYIDGERSTPRTTS